MGFFEERFGQRLGWYLIFRLMLSPMAALAPVMSCGAAITFGAMFGRWGGLFGGLLGLVAGVAFIVFWYSIIVGKVHDHREGEFERRIYEDVEKGILRPKRVAAQPVDAIPLETGPVSPVDLGTDVGTAIARIEVHAENDPAGAVVAAEILVIRHRRDARVASVLARSLLLAARPAEAATRASEALHMAVLSGHMSPVASLVAALWEVRDGFVVEASVSRALAAHFDEAGDTEKADYFRALG